MSLKGKILIVDDEPINLDFFDVMLSRLGFQVVMAEDGEEALEMIQQDKITLTCAHDALFAAGRAAGLYTSEIQATINSAFRGL